MDYIQNRYTENNPAVNKIIEIALKNRKTYILAIGAITNVALAIKKEPKIINKINSEEKQISPKLSKKRNNKHTRK